MDKKNTGEDRSWNNIIHTHLRHQTSYSDGEITVCAELCASLPAGRSRSGKEAATVSLRNQPRNHASQSALLHCCLVLTGGRAHFVAVIVVLADLLVAVFKVIISPTITDGPQNF